VAPQDDRDGRRAGRCALEKYLAGEEPDYDTLIKCIRKGTISYAFVPVLCGSAFKNKGVQPMLDAVVNYLPAPSDVADVKGVKMGTDEPITLPSSDDAPLSALAFKIMTDPFVGRLPSRASIRACSSRRAAC